ncbi:MAG: molecular chaperone TorD family protein [Deltaproteobacteria bacterium]|nr:molecular chaperone TorD family protein [Deltaproteobacteria bacterium]
MQATIQDNLYSLFAVAFDYPTEYTLDAARRSLELLKGRPEYPQSAANEVAAFIEGFEGQSLSDIQGVYSYTFEIASGEYTLDLGYHLFDGFKRANALLALKETYKRCGFDYDAIAKGELPDHLPVVLKFLASLEDKELVAEIRETFLIRALEGLAKNFAKKTDAVYGHLVKAILAVIDTDVKVAGANKKPAGKA